LTVKLSLCGTSFGLETARRVRSPVGRASERGTTGCLLGWALGFASAGADRVSRAAELAEGFSACWR